MIYHLSIDRWQTQQQQVDSLDIKIGSILGFSSALLAILAAILALREAPIPPASLILLGTSFASYLGIMISSLLSYYLKKWEGGPPLDVAWDTARQYNERQMVWWAAERFTRSYENNQSKMKCKIHAVQTNYVLIIVQTITFVGGLVFAVWN